MLNEDDKPHSTLVRDSRAGVPVCLLQPVRSAKGQTGYSRDAIIVLLRLYHEAENRIHVCDSLRCDGTLPFLLLFSRRWVPIFDSDS